jgi:glycosyltransferase involved in cell wall biosynthesis
MKVSLITACYNSAGTLPTAFDSILSQEGVDLEYIVVDGGSKDGTIGLLKEYEPKFKGRMRWVSECDRGMYDAINKGIAMATGDVIGILNADDVLAGDETLAHIAQAFGEQGTGNGERVDCVYADIRFVKEGETVEALRGARTVRYCSAKRWRPWMFRFAAMVPHPSFYVRRECFERLGGYSLDYRICADFELELRYLYLAKLKAAYLPECVVVMRMGGASTAGWRSNVEINREDLHALRVHGIWSCLPLIYLKYLFKIWGFVFKSG